MSFSFFSWNLKNNTYILSGLPEGFKKKVESLLKADCDDENDHMGHVLERKRHYAQILRISGSDESEEVIPQSTPIAPYVQIGPKAALSYSDRMKAAKVEVEDSRNKVYTFF